VLGTVFQNLTGTAAAIGSVTFTAPSSGQVFVMATGYCNLQTPPQTVFLQLNAMPNMISTTNANLTNLAILSNAAGGSLQFPAVVSRAFGVTAGTRTVYLNGMLAAGAGVANCQTNITAFFTPAALP